MEDAGRAEDCYTRDESAAPRNVRRFEEGLSRGKVLDCEERSMVLRLAVIADDLIRICASRHSEFIPMDKADAVMWATCFRARR